MCDTSIARDTAFMWPRAGNAAHIRKRKTKSKAAEFEEWVCQYFGKCVCVCVFFYLSEFCVSVCFTPGISVL